MDSDSSSADSDDSTDTVVVPSARLTKWRRASRPSCGPPGSAQGAAATASFDDLFATNATRIASRRSGAVSDPAGTGGGGHPAARSQATDTTATAAPGHGKSKLPAAPEGRPSIKAEPDSPRCSAQVPIERCLERTTGRERDPGPSDSENQSGGAWPRVCTSAEQGHTISMRPIKKERSEEQDVGDAISEGVDQTSSRRRSQSCKAGVNQSGILHSAQNNQAGSESSECVPQTKAVLEELQDKTHLNSDSDFDEVLSGDSELEEFNDFLEGLTKDLNEGKYSGLRDDPEEHDPSVFPTQSDDQVVVKKEPSTVECVNEAASTIPDSVEQPQPADKRQECGVSADAMSVDGYRTCLSTSTESRESETPTGPLSKCDDVTMLATSPSQDGTQDGADTAGDQLHQPSSPDGSSQFNRPEKPKGMGGVNKPDAITGLDRREKTRKGQEPGRTEPNGTINDAMTNFPFAIPKQCVMGSHSARPGVQMKSISFHDVAVQCGVEADVPTKNVSHSHHCAEQERCPEVVKVKDKTVQVDIAGAIERANVIRKAETADAGCCTSGDSPSVDNKYTQTDIPAKSEEPPTKTKTQHLWSPSSTKKDQDNAKQVDVYCEKTFWLLKNFSDRIAKSHSELEKTNQAIESLNRRHGLPMTEQLAMCTNAVRSMLNTLERGLQNSSDKIKKYAGLEKVEKERIELNKPTEVVQPLRAGHERPVVSCDRSDDGAENRMGADSLAGQGTSRKDVIAQRKPYKTVDSPWARNNKHKKHRWFFEGVFGREFLHSLRSQGEVDLVVGNGLIRLSANHRLALINIQALPGPVRRFLTGTKRWQDVIIKGKKKHGVKKRHLIGELMAGFGKYLSALSGLQPEPLPLNPFMTEFVWHGMVPYFRGHREQALFQPPAGSQGIGSSSPGQGFLSKPIPKNTERSSTDGLIQGLSNSFEELGFTCREESEARQTGAVGCKGYTSESVNVPGSEVSSVKTGGSSLWTEMCNEFINKTSTGGTMLGMAKGDQSKQSGQKTDSLPHEVCFGLPETGMPATEHAKQSEQGLDPHLPGASIGMSNAEVAQGSSWEASVPLSSVESGLASSAPTFRCVIPISTVEEGKSQAIQVPGAAVSSADDQGGPRGSSDIGSQVPGAAVSSADDQGGPRGSSDIGSQVPAAAVSSADDQGRPRGSNDIGSQVPTAAVSSADDQGGPRSSSDIGSQVPAAAVSSADDQGGPRSSSDIGSQVPAASVSSADDQGGPRGSSDMSLSEAVSSPEAGELVASDDEERPQVGGGAASPAAQPADGERAAEWKAQRILREGMDLLEWPEDAARAKKRRRRDSEDESSETAKRRRLSSGNSSDGSIRIFCEEHRVMHDEPWETILHIQTRQDGSTEAVCPLCKVKYDKKDILSHCESEHGVRKPTHQDSVKPPHASSGRSHRTKADGRRSSSSEKAHHRCQCHNSRRCPASDARSSGRESRKHRSSDRSRHRSASVESTRCASPQRRARHRSASVESTARRSRHPTPEHLHWIRRRRCHSPHRDRRRRDRSPSPERREQNRPRNRSGSGDRKRRNGTSGRYSHRSPENSVNATPSSRTLSRRRSPSPEINAKNYSKYGSKDSGSSRSRRTSKGTSRNSTSSNGSSQTLSTDEESKGGSWSSSDQRRPQDDKLDRGQASDKWHQVQSVQPEEPHVESPDPQTSTASSVKPICFNVKRLVKTVQPSPVFDENAQKRKGTSPPPNDVPPIKRASEEVSERQLNFEKHFFSSSSANVTGGGGSQTPENANQHVPENTTAKKKGTKGRPDTKFPKVPMPIGFTEEELRNILNVCKPKPKVDNSKPEDAAPTPEVTAPIPEVLTPTPEANTSTPEVPAPTPEVTASTPKVTVSTPEVDAPTLEIVRLMPEVSAQTLAVTASTSETRTPAFEVAAPTSKDTALTSEVLAPTPQVASPASTETVPKPETAVPKLVILNSKTIVATYKPQASTVKPKPETKKTEHTVLISELTTQKPELTTQKPEIPIQKPEIHPHLSNTSSQSANQHPAEGKDGDISFEDESDYIAVIEDSSEDESLPTPLANDRPGVRKEPSQRSCAIIDPSCGGSTSRGTKPVSSNSASGESTQRKETDLKSQSQKITTHKLTVEPESQEKHGVVKPAAVKKRHNSKTERMNATEEMCTLDQDNKLPISSDQKPLNESLPSFDSKNVSEMHQKEPELKKMGTRHIVSSESCSSTSVAEKDLRDAISEQTDMNEGIHRQDTVQQGASKEKIQTQSTAHQNVSKCKIDNQPASSEQDKNQKSGQTPNITGESPLEVEAGGSEQKEETTSAVKSGTIRYHCERCRGELTTLAGLHNHEKACLEGPPPCRQCKRKVVNQAAHRLTCGGRAPWLCLFCHKWSFDLRPRHNEQCSAQCVRCGVQGPHLCGKGPVLPTGQQAPGSPTLRPRMFGSPAGRGSPPFRPRMFGSSAARSPRPFRPRGRASSVRAPYRPRAAAAPRRPVTRWNSRQEVYRVPDGDWTQDFGRAEEPHQSGFGYQESVPHREGYGNEQCRSCGAWGPHNCGGQGQPGMWCQQCGAWGPHDCRTLRNSVWESPVRINRF